VLGGAGAGAGASLGKGTCPIVASSCKMSLDNQSVQVSRRCIAMRDVLKKPCDLPSVRGLSRSIRRDAERCTHFVSQTRIDAMHLCTSVIALFIWGGSPVRFPFHIFKRRTTPLVKTEDCIRFRIKIGFYQSTRRMWVIDAR
jgi:hypothetical protein